MASKPKGRPPLEPRILALEGHNYVLQGDCSLKEYVLLQDQRIAALERRVAEMNEAFSRAAFPRAPQQEYGSQTN